MKHDRDKLYLYIAILAVVISAVYWTAFSLNQYHTFQIGGADWGVWSYNLYYDIHAFNVAHGLQLFEFGNHLSLAPLLLIPIFYAFQSIWTLLVFQIVVLSLTALAVFLIVRNLTKRAVFGLAFCIAFLLNPGIYGIYTASFHPESMIILPFLLVFYFFMKLNKKLFFASALLLLGVLEVTPFIAVTLGVGLFLFSILYSNDKKVRNRRLILASSLIVISVLALLAYHLATANLLAAETTGQYANVPSMLKLVAFEAQQTSSLTNVGSSVAAVSSKISLLNVGFVAYGVWIALLSFGIAVIFCPELAIVFAGPWFAELFLARNYNFTLVWLPYFSYVLGGTIVAATLGIMLAQEKRGYAYWILSKIRGKGHGPMLAKLVLVTLVVSIVALNIIYPFFVSSKVKSSELTNVTQDLLFQVSPQQSLMYRQLGSIVKLLPANASVMTQFYIVPHLISRQDMELIPNAGFGVTHVNNFTPEYILVDLNQSVVPYIETPVVPYEQGYVYNLTKNASAGYSLWAQNGSALLYKRS